MLRTPRPRRGLTLVEVLIAMFIMAIGMIAIFTLFPLGAIKIGQALKDDRCSQTAAQADAYLRTYWRTEVVAKLGATPGVTGVTEPFFGAMQTGATTSSPPYSDTPTPSFPVLIDPLGWGPRAGRPDQTAVAATASAGTLARRKFDLVTDAAAIRVASMSDDLTFEPNGAPSATEVLTRQGRYSWAALVQRTKSQPRGQAELTILVFDGRARLPAITGGGGAYNDELMLTPFTRSTPLPEILTPVAGDRQVTVKVPVRGADDPVLVRDGGWVLVYNPTTQATKFHRVVAAAEDINNPGLFTLDLETPLAGTPLEPLTTLNLYFFAGLAEVFERVPLGPDANF